LSKIFYATRKRKKKRRKKTGVQKEGLEKRKIVQGDLSFGSSYLEYLIRKRAGAGKQE
jgi:hypothetical protein